jgi:hypothetical protein
MSEQMIEQSSILARLCKEIFFGSMVALVIICPVPGLKNGLVVDDLEPFLTFIVVEDKTSFFESWH